MMRLLFMNGRHWKIILIITMQYPLGIPPNLRTNIDYVFILREPYLIIGNVSLKTMLVCSQHSSLLPGYGPVHRKL